MKMADLRISNLSCVKIWVLQSDGCQKLSKLHEIWGTAKIVRRTKSEVLVEK
jgi:NRPS condensation-like uncharacterized protein